MYLCMDRPSVQAGCDDLEMIDLAHLYSAR